MEVLKLQCIYLSYIAVTDSFDWKSFIEKWKEDEVHLFLSGQASFICNVIDEERTLNLNFNTAILSEGQIMNIIAKWEQEIDYTVARWEQEIGHIARTSKKQRIVTLLRGGRNGNKYRIRLLYI